MKSLKTSNQATLVACYFGYITQAIINNLFPLLMLIFQRTWNLTLSQLAAVASFNFAVQLITDVLCIRLVDRIGYRKAAIAAHGISVSGLISLALLPFVIEPYAGILVSVMFYAIGGGMIEVLISPIVEACPLQNKEAAMSLLHSFYCWGHVGVVLLSTLFFVLFSSAHWRILTMLWALVPFVNLLLFTQVPIYSIDEEKGTSTLKQLFTNRLFWLFILLMIASGAAEHAMSQWASAFAESGLKMSKTLGDLLGPCLFALLMGIARALYGKNSDRISLSKVMAMSAFLCIISFLLAGISKQAFLALTGCALAGFSVGIFWPGTLSLAIKSIPSGGTALFALLALAGDIGCSVGPALVGLIAETKGLQSGLLWAAVFPGLILLCLLFITGKKK